MELKYKPPANLNANTQPVRVEVLATVDEVKALEPVAQDSKVTS